MYVYYKYKNNIINEIVDLFVFLSKPQKMTEKNLREFDQMTRGDRSSTRERERPKSPGASSIKSSRLALFLVICLRNKASNVKSFQQQKKGSY